MSTSCFDSDVMLEAASGHLESVSLDRFADHLEACDICRDRFTRILRLDAVRMSERSAETGVLPTPELDRAVERLKTGYHWMKTSTEIGGRFQVIRRIGQGGMGEVFECFDRKLNRVVALKKIHLEEFSGLMIHRLERLEREARIQAGLNHPNIVQIFETGQTSGVPFIVMELVSGGSLRDSLLKRPLSARHAAALVAQLARAMAYAHQKGVVHRDLKPANVMLTGAWFPENSGSPAIPVPKIADFGLAKCLDEVSDLSHSGMIIGTPAYLSPEQARGGKTTIGPATDIYSLGVILYESITGHPPFNVNSHALLLALIENSEPVSPRKLVPGLSRDLETICLKCLEKEANRRYATALAMAEDLEHFLAGRPIHARPVGLAGQFRRWCRRNLSLAASLALVLMLILMMTAGSVAFGLSQSRLRRFAEAEGQRASQFAREAEKERDNALELYIFGIARLSNLTSVLINPKIVHTESKEVELVRRNANDSYHYLVDRFVNDSRNLKTHRAEAIVFLYHSVRISEKAADGERLEICLNNLERIANMPAEFRATDLQLILMSFTMVARYYDANGRSDRAIETVQRARQIAGRMDPEFLKGDSQSKRDLDELAAKYEESL